MSFLILPERKFIEPSRDLILGQRCSGHFLLEATDVVTGRKRKVAEFDNLITNAGLDLHGSTTQQVVACVVGTGNAAPANTDTNLQTPIAWTGTVQASSKGYSGASEYYTWHRKTFRFGAGVAAGNLAEIGIRSASGSVTAGTLFSRALILDAGGSPTTITILGTEVLDATYEYRIYPPLVDGTGTFQLSGVTYNYTMRAIDTPNWGMYATSAGWQGGVGFSATSQVSAYRGTGFALAAFTASVPTGTVIGSPSSGSNQTYTGSSYYRDAQYTFDLNSANDASGIGGFVFGMGLFPTSGGEGTASSKYQMSVSPVIPKDNTKNLVMNVRHSWARRTIP